MIDFIRMRKLIEQVPERWFAIERAHSRAEGLQTQKISDMPRVSGDMGDRLERDVIDLCDLYDAYAETLEELRGMKMELMPYIDKLTVPKERAVMRLRYLCGYSVRKIAEDENHGMPRTTVCRYLNSAETKIKKMQGGTKWH